METFDSLLTRYCQVFGYSSCSNLTLVEMSVLIGVGVLVLFAVATVFRRVFTGVSD